MANQKQSVIKFLMGANCHSSVGLVANLNALGFFMRVIGSDETDRPFSLLPLFFSSKETRDGVYFMSEANG